MNTTYDTARHDLLLRAARGELLMHEYAAGAVQYTTRGGASVAFVDGEAVSLAGVADGLKRAWRDGSALYVCGNRCARTAEGYAALRVRHAASQ